MKVKYFFDTISPYSALSFKVWQRYQKPWNVEMTLVPVFLGGIMKGTGNQPPAMLPSRAVFQAGDLARNKAMYDVDILPTPSNFFSEVARSIISCQRLIVAAQQANLDVFPLVDSITNAVHLEKSFRSAENDLVIDQSFLEKCCENAGYNKDTTSSLLAACSTDTVKQQLLANTQEAIDEGAYGSPTMIIEGGVGEFKEPFLIFGSDRFEQIAFCCGKEYRGPNPSKPSKL